MILELVDEAVRNGARRAKVCKFLGLPLRSLQRWREQGIGEDRRHGPKTSPANKLSPAEESHILEVLHSPEFRDLSPKQLVPILADRGIFLASESTLYRILRKEGEATYRSPAMPPIHRYRPDEKVATGPNQVWSWDITYLKTSVRGIFFYLYLFLDVWSRKIVGWEVHEEELSKHSARLAELTIAKEGVDRHQLILHSDHGGPMKGSTMLATLQKLGVVPSFSRPRVSDDNPFSESLFRTLKYRPEFPRKPFDSLEESRQWVAWFVPWYNTQHRHSGIRFVTPEERHLGLEEQILENRKRVYEEARSRHPKRWSGKIRNWDPIQEVRLNPSQNTRVEVA